MYNLFVKKRIEYTKQTYNGINFDSLTELNFYQAHEGLVDRCEESFEIWKSLCGEESITYTPDFIANDGTFIEIKGAAEPKYWNEGFVARLPIIRDFFARQNLKFVILVPQAGKWVSPLEAKESKRENLLEAQKEIKTIWNLIYERKSLKQAEKDYLVGVLTAPMPKWLGLRRGSMVKKARQLTILRGKLKSAKCPYAALNNILLKGNI